MEVAQRERCLCSLRREHGPSLNLASWLSGGQQSDIQLSLQQGKHRSPPSHQRISYSTERVTRKHKSAMPSPTPFSMVFQSIIVRLWSFKIQNSLFHSIASKHKPTASCGALLRRPEISFYPRGKVGRLNSLTNSMSVSNAMPPWRFSKIVFPADDFCLVS